MSKRRNFESHSDDASCDSQSSNRASLEANRADEKLPADLPKCPTDGKFLSLLPYIYDYCSKVANFRGPSEAGQPIKVPLPGNKKFHSEANKCVNKGYSMIDTIDLGKSGSLYCNYQIKDGKEMISFDKSEIRAHSLVWGFLKSKESFTTERQINSGKPMIVFYNSAKKLPKALQEHIHADPREIIVGDPYAPAEIPFNKRADIDQKAEKKK